MVWFLLWMTEGGLGAQRGVVTRTLPSFTSSADSHLPSKVIGQKPTPAPEHCTAPFNHFVFGLKGQNPPNVRLVSSDVSAAPFFLLSLRRAYTPPDIGHRLELALLHPT